MAAPTATIDNTPPAQVPEASARVGQQGGLNARTVDPILLKNNVTLTPQALREARTHYAELGESMKKREKIFNTAIVVLAIVLVCLIIAYIPCTIMKLHSARAALGMTMQCLALIGIVWGKIHDCRPAKSADCEYYEKVLADAELTGPGFTHFSKHFARDYTSLEAFLQAYKGYRIDSVRTV